LNSTRAKPQPRCCPAFSGGFFLGSNPAVIQVGDSYADLGATIASPAVDLNLGIRFFVNGAPVSTIAFDTTQVATDTIDYVVTDPSGMSQPRPVPWLFKPSLAR